MSFQRIAAGGKTASHGLAEYQFYKGPGPDEFLILELKLGSVEGDAVGIEGGTMTVVMKGRQVFRAAVKGSAGCQGKAAPGAAQNPASAQGSHRRDPAPAAIPFDRYAVRANIVPIEIIRAAQQSFGCAAELMRSSAVGFVISPEAAVWQMGCERVGYQTSSVFALVQFEMPGRNYRFLEFRSPRGRERTIGSALLLDPEWNLPTRTVTSIVRGRAQGDCGTLERHRVTESGEFVLTEYREKKDCDGIGSQPQDWPLVFRAN